MDLMIYNKTRSRIGLKTVELVLKKFQKANKIKKSISVIFIGDQKMKRINYLYRKKDKTTDVLSFEGEDDYLGDIFINYQQIKRQAKIYSRNIKEELVFILVHGLLHLLGYNDKTKKGRAEMENLGKKFVKKIMK